MRFQYFEIRACVEHKGAIQSFLGEPEHHPHIGAAVHTPAGAAIEAAKFSQEHLGCVKVFWTLYGLNEDGPAVAVGDFSTFEAAYEVMSAILAPMVEAYHQLMDKDVDDATSTLEDFLNQCSNKERL